MRRAGMSRETVPSWVTAGAAGMSWIQIMYEREAGGSTGAGGGHDRVGEARAPPATLFPVRRFPASMEEYFKALTLWLASGSEAAAALVIGLATIEATLRDLWLFV